MNAVSFKILPSQIATLIDALQQQVSISHPQQESETLDFLDGFDWPLYKKDLCLIRVHKGKQAELQLCRHSDPSIMSKMPAPANFRFVQDLPDHPLKRMLGGFSLRALLVQISLHCDVKRWRILNRNEKTIAWLSLHSYRIIDKHAPDTGGIFHLAQLTPLRGYENKTNKLLALITKTTDIEADSQSVLQTALQTLGRSTSEHDTKIKTDLHRQMDAHEALASILLRLLEIMQQNEAGIIDDIDTEFLHDFRIAVRKTRSIIGSIKDVFARTEIDHFKEEFSWLGDMTGPLRDLDVHLLEFGNYRNMLPHKLGDDIEPVRELIESERKQSYTRLRKALRSQRYRKLKQDWYEFLHNADRSGQAPCRLIDAANASIWRIYRNTIRKGIHLSAGSSPEAFHDERKACKKLRYLLEFFRPLYPKKELRRLIRALQDIQDQLGQFQDLEVQELAFHDFADRLMERENTNSGTLLALGVLIERIRQQRIEVMAEFAEHFEAFNETRNRKLFKQIFKKDSNSP